MPYLCRTPSPSPFYIALRMKKLLSLFLVAAALASCSKKDDSTPTPIPASPTELLTAKSWRISAETSSTAITGSPTPIVQDEYANMKACERDDFTKFNTDKSATFDEGATKCSTTDPQTQTGSWSLNSANTQLTIKDPTQGSTIVFDVVTLSATTLSLRYSTSYSSGGISATITENVTFTAF